MFGKLLIGNLLLTKTITLIVCFSTPLMNYCFYLISYQQTCQTSFTNGVINRDIPNSMRDSSKAFTPVDTKRN